MIMPRREFTSRWTFRAFETIKEIDERVLVKRLMKEIKADAPYRNHEYLFDGTDMTKFPIPEHEVAGVRDNKKHIKDNPEHKNIKFEGERFAIIEEQMRENTYRPVPLFRHMDYPNVLYIDDGFHRIFMANKLGLKFIRCKTKYGYYKYSKNINMVDLRELLKILVQMFPKRTLRGLLKILEKADPGKMRSTSIGYGKEEE